MRIPVLFESAHATAEREVLVDSGATDNFISKKLLHRLKISYLPVEHLSKSGTWMEHTTEMAPSVTSPTYKYAPKVKPRPFNSSSPTWEETK